MGQCEILAFCLAAAISVLIQKASSAAVGNHDKFPTLTEQGGTLIGPLDNLAYSNYLKEVLALLQADESSEGTALEAVKNFRNASPRIRSKLDELKRKELREIRNLMEEIRSRGADPKELKQRYKKYTRYLDPRFKNFDTQDLKRLLVQANTDLTLMDVERRERFKEYEMYKSLEYDTLLKRLSPKIQEIVTRNRAAMVAHQNAKPMVMPMSMSHLRKVWQERDHMNKENFNLKTFFHLHDLDGNGFWDEDELKVTLEDLIHEYHTEGNIYDRHEATEDMERMREYAFKEMDTNTDRLIDLEEFLYNSKRNGHSDHTFWQSIKNVPVYTPEEYEQYKEKNQHLLDDMADKGHITMNISGFVVFHDLRDKTPKPTIVLTDQLSNATQTDIPSEKQG